jgi:predicted negative regulator of RcsB-dependent stress response
VDDFDGEKEQWDYLKGWIGQNGPWILAGVVVGSGAIWGWNAYQAHRDREARAASLQYEQLIDAYGRNDRSRAASLLAALERDHAGSAYVDQARLAAARMAVEAKDLANAANELRSVMSASHDPELALVARLRLARVLLAQGESDAALATVGAAPPGTAFAPEFAEVRGDALLAKGDRIGALAAYREAGAARSAGVLDTATLDLKIRDLASP